MKRRPMQRSSTMGRRICMCSFFFCLDEKMQTHTHYTSRHPIMQTERSCNDSQRSHPACWAVLLSYLNWLANWSPHLGTRTLRVLKGSVWQSPILIFPCLKKMLCARGPTSSVLPPCWGLCKVWSKPSRPSMPSSKPASWSSSMWEACPIRISQSLTKSGPLVENGGNMFPEIWFWKNAIEAHSQTASPISM